jgi:pilus assembly protein FimV
LPLFFVFAGGFNGMLLRGKYVNKEALSLAVCLAVSYSPASYALGLGEIESSSHLNQPFRAKINLLSTSVADVKRLQVRVASPEVFSRVGIEHSDYLNTINFEPTIENGKPVIIVSSSQPINQPFLNFLIEVSWPNGQLLKEYTVLLDPPVLVQGETAIANNTVGVRPEPQRQVAKQVEAPAKSPQVTAQSHPATPKKQLVTTRNTSAPAHREAAKKSNRTSRYRVVRGDTLSKIAKKLRYRGVRDEQMMMALFRANPTAFRKRNINNLKAGSLLYRPSASDARRLTYKQAKLAIYKQSRQWRKYRSKLAKNTVPQKQVKSSGKSASTPLSAPKNTQAHIEVVGSSSPVDNNNLSATGEARVDQLERELIQAKESLVAKANANMELKSRVSELESLLRKKNRLITLKNEQLAELQAKLGMPATANNTADEGSDIGQQVKNSAAEGEGTIVRGGEELVENTTQQADPATTEPDNSQQLAVVDGSGTDIPSIFEQTPDNTPGETTLQTPEEQAGNGDKTVVGFPHDTTANAAENKDGVLDLLGSPLVMGLGGGSLLALLLAWLLMRRKGNSGDSAEYSSIDFNNPEFAPGSSSKEDSKAEKTDSDNAFAGLEGDFDGLDFGDSAETNIKDNKTTSSAIDTNDDILQEADVYIVYGLYDQAEVELKKAIEKQPDNLHYHAKLLENYHASSNIKSFDKQAEIFSKLADDADGNKAKLWKKITEWAQEIKSENTLFNKSPKASSMAGIAAAAVAGGVAVTAGKALAADASDNQSDVNDPDIKTEDYAKNIDELDLTDVSQADDLDFDASNLDLPKKSDFSADELDLEDILGDSDDDLQDTTKTAFDSLDNTSLDDLLDDVEADKTDVAVKPEVKGQETELGSDFEDLLDLDLTDLSDDLSADKNKHNVSNLNLELNNDHDLNKILPTGSPYTSTKDDVPDSNNLLGDLDDDLSFMDLDDNDDDLKEAQISTKLDLARAYLDMGDMEGARNTLEEVMMEGNDDQKKEAEELLHQAG